MTCVLWISRRGTRPAGPIYAGLGSGMGEVTSPLMRERDFRSAEGMQRAAG
jgi:hypothetical protein